MDSMEKCPQCGIERVAGENFCDSCGHKYAAGSESQDQQQPEQVQDQQQPAISGRLSMRDSSGAEILSIQFDDVPKTVGRQDVSELLTSQGKDPLQISRKHCTIFKEGDDYYIEDGTTSVQEKPSGNHTTVNGKDITGQGRIKLADNDQVVLAMLADATFCLM